MKPSDFLIHFYSILVIVVLFEVFTVFIFLWNFLSVKNIFDSQLLGVIIGGFIAILSGYLLWIIREIHNIRNISKGFLTEIRNYDDWINQIVPRYQNNTRSFIFDTTLERPIITDNSLYFIFRRELFKFNAKLIDSLLIFYSHLMTAEENRKSALYVFKNNPTDIGGGSEYQINMVEALKSAKSQIPDTIDQLTGIINRNSISLFFYLYLKK